MYKVYGTSASGNCHKVRMVLEALRLPYSWTEIDSVRGQTRTPEFLEMNPNGKVPVLEIEPGLWMSESNAILVYLADGSTLVPTDRLQRARALQWMFFEQYSHEPYIAVARYLRRFHPDPASVAELAQSKREGGDRALGVMEQHLEKQDFFAGPRYTVADIALYAYTHVASEGGFDLGRYPAIRDWLARVEAQPGYAAMPEA
jgi:glutathione S-transferase